jgi:CRISPR/Cas system-associated exonuclease Cas4 (RecB family)
MPAAEFPSLFVFSQSSLQDYDDCPRRFQLRYLERLAWPALESEPTIEYERRQQAGQVFHRMAQQALVGIPLERLEKLAEGPELTRWWQNFSAEFANITRAARLYPELTLSAPLGGQRLTAKFDLVAVSGSQAVIYDWKTYHRRPRNEDLALRWQTRVYRWLLTEAGKELNDGQGFKPEDVEMVYWFTEFPDQAARFRYNSGQFERDRAGLEKMIAEITQAREYPKAEETQAEKACRFCPYRSYCARGDIAGDWREAELADEALPQIFIDQIAEIEL